MRTILNPVPTRIAHIAPWRHRLVKSSTVYHMVVEQDEDGVLIGSVPELPGCHTGAKHMRTLKRRLQVAVELWTETVGRA